MRQSKLFTKTLRLAPKDEEAVNARLLTRAGFIEKVMAGVYSFLPLGVRVMQKIESIVREEMNTAGGQEILMPALHPKENWEKTGRWKNFDALYKVISHFDSEYALGPTHEEIVVPLAAKHLFSYRDLPFAVYQIQTKFRDEARVKSGLLRGREFRMKDMYSFHANSEDVKAYYEKIKAVYGRIFERVGIKAVLTEASGGTFSEYSHEFQVLTPTGEDTIFLCGSCGYAKNKEIVKENEQCKCGGKFTEHKGIEVGNIFELNTRFSEPFNLSYKDESGKTQPIYMGCYGLGISRLMGAVAEVVHDDAGLIWPEAVAPFKVHLLSLSKHSEHSDVKSRGDYVPLRDKFVNSDYIYENLLSAGVEVLYDERDVSPGEKLKDADLIGIPWRAIVSEKTGDKIEVKRREETEVKLMTVKEFLNSLTPTT